MQRKTFILAVVLLVIAILGLSWYLRPTAVTPSPAKSDAPRPVAQTVPANPPVIPPVPPKLVAASVPSVTPAPTPAGSPAELKAAIQEYADMTRTGDVVGMYQNLTPPDKFDPQTLQRLIDMRAEASMNPSPVQSPQLQNINEAMAKSFEALKGQTPTYNEAGDEATYIWTRPTPGDMNAGVFTGSGKQSRTIFIKVNGKWYLKQG